MLHDCKPDKYREQGSITVVRLPEPKLRVWRPQPGSWTASSLPIKISVGVVLILYLGITDAGTEVRQ
jgi:hypothetical protein